MLDEQNASDAVPGKEPVSLDDNKLTYTLAEAATRLGISTWLAYEAAHRGELPVCRIGRRMLVPRAALLRLLAQDPSSVRNRPDRHAIRHAWRWYDMTEVRCWRDQAACLEVVSADYDPFFADATDLQAEAIAICETCPVRDACLTFAVRTGQQYGIWGGQPQQIIRRLIALDRAGRPQDSQVTSQSSPGQQDPLQARPSLRCRQHLLRPRWPAPLPHLPARRPTHPCPSTPARRRRRCGVTATPTASTTRPGHLLAGGGGAAVRRLRAGVADRPGRRHPLRRP